MPAVLLRGKESAGAKTSEIDIIPAATHAILRVAALVKYLGLVHQDGWGNAQDGIGRGGGKSGGLTWQRKGRQERRGAKLRWEGAETRRKPGDDDPVCESHTGSFFGALSNELMCRASGNLGEGEIREQAKDSDGGSGVQENLADGLRQTVDGENRNVVLNAYKL
eukprot:768700-Hanusia_phi.AAC.3